MREYCGPFWMPKAIRRILSKKFNASCKIHDLDYASKKYSRKQADLRFKVNTLKQAGNSKFWRFIAKIFYLAVRIGGQISYNRDIGK